MKIYFPKIVIITALGLLLFILSSIPARHLGSVFWCGEYEGKVNTFLKREHHGFPIVIYKRSISSSSCTNLTNKYYGSYGPMNSTRYLMASPNETHEIQDTGYIIVANIFADIIFWLFISWFIYFIYEHIKRRNR
jgi:hypothetical protein